MKIVRTVLGDVEPQSLGHTQCHEHIFIERDKSAEVSDVLLIDDFDKSAQELERYRAAGGGALVDAQPVLAGRMAEWLREASRRSGVAIVGATGFHKTVFYYEDSYIFHDTETRIAERYADEIERGMAASRAGGGGITAARAGIVKTAVDAGGIRQDAVYQKLHAAAAAAAVRTGAPLMCHIEQGADAAEVADFYLGAGVAADRIWLAHLDRADYDFNVHRDILARGVYLEYDTIARFTYHSDEKESSLFCAMLDAGYGAQILMGLDTTRARLKSYGADTGLDYILREFLPRLEADGVSGAQIRQMTVENPARALGIEI